MYFLFEDKTRFHGSFVIVSKISHIIQVVNNGTHDFMKKDSLGNALAKHNNNNNKKTPHHSLTAVDYPVTLGRIRFTCTN